MEKALVGCTGFVGSNLDRSTAFDGRYHSANIAEAFGTRPELLVYAGVRAEKFLANVQPEKDLENIREAFDNICRIEPKRLVLISTADVYKDPVGVDESTPIDEEDLHAYGANRYCLEKWVREKYPEAVIVRLPALYGRGLKKNFIYDYIQRIPPMLTVQKYEELRAADDFLVPYYADQGNGFYQCGELSDRERQELRAYFVRVGFSSLQFTDSRSRFQFYPLDRLWADLETILAAGRRLVNIVTEPVSAGEVYRYLCGGTFVNETAKGPVSYDIRSRYGADFGAGDSPYLLDKQAVLDGLKRFVSAQEG